MSHRIGHCGPRLRVPVGLLVVGSIASQRGPCHRRVFDPFCNGKRHKFSRWSLDRCRAVLLEEIEAKTTRPAAPCVCNKADRSTVQRVNYSGFKKKKNFYPLQFHISLLSFNETLGMKRSFNTVSHLYSIKNKNGGVGNQSN